MRKQKRRGLIFGMLAVVLALTTGFIFTSQISELQHRIGDMQQVVVAKHAIPPRTQITADMLELQEIPRLYAHPSYIQSIADVADQRIAVVPLAEGAIVRQSDVAPANGLEDGWRGLSIGVNPVAVLVDRVQTGSHVDVIVSYETTYLDAEGKEVQAKRTATLLSDVEVLSIAGAPQPRATLQRTDNEASAASAAQGGSDLGPADAVPADAFGNNYGLRDSVVIATLKVSPTDAQQLAYMDTYASDIRLALRRNDDRAIEPLKPLSEEDFK